MGFGAAQIKFAFGCVDATLAYGRRHSTNVPIAQFAGGHGCDYIDMWILAKAKDSVKEGHQYGR